MNDTNVTSFNPPVSDAPTTTGATPAASAGSPTGTTDQSANAAPAQAAATSGDAASAGSASALRFVDRVVQGAHQAIDGLAAKATSKVDAVGQGASKITNTRDEWVGAARDAIRQRPFAAMGVALLIGAAYVSLRSSRRN